MRALTLGDPSFVSKATPAGGGGGAAPPTSGRISWFAADALSLADGASLASWPDADGNANLTLNSGATVTYHTSAGTQSPNSKPYADFNETGGLQGTRSVDSGSVLSMFFVCRNNFPTGPLLLREGPNTNFWVEQTGGGQWKHGGIGSITAGDTFGGNIWRILLFIWNGSSSKLYQSGGAAAGTGTITGTNGTGTNLGGSTGAGTWHGQIAESIWYTTTSLTTLNTAGAYLASKYALTWTTAT